MSSIEIIIPEATENEIENPSIERATTGWIAVGSTRTRELDYARFGRASLKVVPDGAAVNEGVYYSVNPAAASESRAGSGYVRGDGLVRARLVDQTNGLEWASDPVQITTDIWRRLEVLGFLGSGACADLRLYFETARKVQSSTFYVDGAQIEAKAYVTSYVDGTLEDDIDDHDGLDYFRWIGAAHDSKSQRAARYWLGGRPIDLTEGLDVNLYPTAIAGFGLPPFRITTQEFTAVSGVKVQRAKALARSLTILFWAVTHGRGCDPASLKKLHKARRILIDQVIGHDDVNPAVLLRYLDGRGPLEMEAVYEAGLEFDGDIRGGFVDSFPVRFLCPRPWWESDSQDVAELTASQTVGDADYILGRIAGEWQALGTGANGAVYAIGVHPNGDVYAGGAFTSMGGVANTARIARWDGSAWNALATGIDNNNVYAIAFGPDGTVYIGGDFTTIGAVTHNRITRYNPSTDTFSTMGAGAPVGLNGTVYAIDVAADGDAFIGGSFTATAAAAPTTLNRICYWVPGTNTFTAMGTAPGLDNTVRAVKVDINGDDVFIGGDFTDIAVGTIAAIDYMCMWDESASNFIALYWKEGAGNVVRAIAVSKSGYVYLGGDFTGPGDATVEKIAYWSRASFQSLGGDAFGVGGGDVYSLAEMDDGTILAGGDFTQAQDSPLSTAITAFNRTNFSHLDVILPGSPNVRAIAVRGDDVFLGFTTSGNATAAEVQTVTNDGSADGEPVLEVRGPARLEWLENQTVGAIIKFDLTVQDEEEVFVDLRPGKLRAESEFRGSVIAGLKPDSDVGSFKVAPGDNVLAFLAESTDGGSEISLRWRTRERSFDAG